jgi:hypothetical protein
MYFPIYGILVPFDATLNISLKHRSVNSWKMDLCDLPPCEIIDVICRISSKQTEGGAMAWQERDDK